MWGRKALWMSLCWLSTNSLTSSTKLLMSFASLLHWQITSHLVTKTCIIWHFGTHMIPNFVCFALEKVWWKSQLCSRIYQFNVVPLLFQFLQLASLETFVGTSEPKMSLTMTLRTAYKIFNLEEGSYKEMQQTSRTLAPKLGVVASLHHYNMLVDRLSIWASWLSSSGIT